MEIDSEHVRAARWAATATVLSAVITAGATLAATMEFTEGATDPAASHVEPVQSASLRPDTLAAAEARISMPAGHRVDTCTAFSGTGSIPGDVVLWIAVRDAQGYLFLSEPVDIRQGEWTTSAIQISDGDEKDRTEERTVLALGVPRVFSDVLQDFSRTGLGPTTHELPGVRTLHEIRVTPSGLDVRCPA
jgi:hypothetical protein